MVFAVVKICVMERANGDGDCKSNYCCTSIKVIITGGQNIQQLETAYVVY